MYDGMHGNNRAGRLMISSLSLWFVLVIVVVDPTSALPHLSRSVSSERFACAFESWTTTTTTRKRTTTTTRATATVAIDRRQKKLHDSAQSIPGIWGGGGRRRGRGRLLMSAATQEETTPTTSRKDGDGDGDPEMDRSGAGAGSSIIPESKEAWDSYEAVVSEISSRERIMGSKLKKNQTAVEEVRRVLLSDRVVVAEISDDPAKEEEEEDGGGGGGGKTEPGTTTTRAAATREVLRSRRGSFAGAAGFTDLQYEFYGRCLTYVGDECAKRNLVLPAVTAWRKIRECGLAPRENCVSTYMYALGEKTPSTSTSTGGTTDGGTDALVEATLGDVATLHDALFRPNEKTVYLRIKALVRRGNHRRAEEILSSLPDKDEEGEGGKGGVECKRLRTFLPILEHHCDVTGDATAILRLFRRMMESGGAHMDAGTYALVIGALAARGFFVPGADPIPGANERGGCFPDGVGAGPDLFDAIAAEMADDILDLDEESARIIYESLVSGFSDHRDGDEDDVGSGGFPSFTDVDNRVVAGRVTVDERTAVCRQTGARLRLFALTDGQRLHVRDKLFEMARAQHEEHSDKLKSRGMRVWNGSGEYAAEKLSAFSDWLSRDRDRTYTCFVDGPNVAYFGHGGVHYSQVQLVVDELEMMGERPLVIMPEKYAKASFFIPGLGSTQCLSRREMDILRWLNETGRMYVVPATCLDDYYWMLAGVTEQSQPHDVVPAPTADDHDDSNESNENGGGDTNEDGDGRRAGGRRRRRRRLPGLRPLLVTNDQMRDHRLALLEARPFRRWTSCHIVNYNISSYDNTEWERRDVEFFPADFFSREIQRNPIPVRAEEQDDGGAARRENGNATTTTTTMAWHFPVRDWDECDRLCVCIKR